MRAKTTLAARRRIVVRAGDAGCAATTGCDSDSVERASGRGGGRRSCGSGSRGRAASKEREPFVFKDDDFVESVRNRDPFRSYTDGVQGQGARTRCSAAWSCRRPRSRRCS